MTELVTVGEMRGCDRQLMDFRLTDNMRFSSPVFFSCSTFASKAHHHCMRHITQRPLEHTNRSLEY